MADTEQFRLRRFVEKLAQLGECEVHDQPIELLDVAGVLDGNPRATLFRAVGPEKAELVGNVMGSRRRLAIALDTEEINLLPVLAQRLARKLCTNCCEMYVPTVDELVAARLAPESAQAREGMVLYRKVGCPRCNRTGYKGRIGVFQLLIVNDEIEALAARSAPREEIERAAAAAGMRSLWDDGIAKAAAGLTSIEELARVVSL